MAAAACSSAAAALAVASAEARAASVRSAGPSAGPRPALAPLPRPSTAPRCTRIARPPRAAGGGPQPPKPPLPSEEDFDADAPPGFWDSDAAGVLSIGGGIAALVGCVVLLLSLARPVIDATVGAFPVRSAGEVEAGVASGRMVE